MHQREWKRCTDPGKMLFEASLALLVPAESEAGSHEATAPARGRPDNDLPEFAFFEAEAARARRRFRIFTLTAAQPLLQRVDNAVCHAAAEVGWQLAEGTASAEELAEIGRELQAAYDAAHEAVRVYFVTPPELCILPRLINVLTLLVNALDGMVRRKKGLRNDQIACRHTCGRLQDAGCDNTEILKHCRDPKQTHARLLGGGPRFGGCWVVDLVLAKI